jgi:2-polyprenyl-6-hydroxyphenyl methylase/3-demethylubiquinone-9 3-methyltransferase
MNNNLKFSFGKNWENFIKNYLNNERIDEAKKALTNFLGINSFNGKTFLDIGCGSGLHSFAAYKLKAKKIVSFDIDPFSVECTKYFFKIAGEPKNWKIYQGSILDKKFIQKLGKFDIVYSWGVLHHTGDMWNAIKNAASLVKKNGLFYIAIYNKVDAWGIWSDGRFGPSSFWQKEKNFILNYQLSYKI